VAIGRAAKLYLSDLHWRDLQRESIDQITAVAWRERKRSTGCRRAVSSPLREMGLSMRSPLVVLTACALLLAACAPDYSPNTYSTAALQHANDVKRGVIVGFREVKISADGTIGAVTGGATGGILGAEAGAGGVTAALGGVGGTLIGGIVGSTIERAGGDTTGFEYIVREEPKGDLVSVAQRQPQPLPVGQKVLVIAGNQARIVPDYAVDVPPKAAAPGAPTSAASAPSAQPSPAPTTAPNAPPAEPPAQGPPTPLTR
jgi:outer membrane lipoprotein SlyB